MVKKLIGPSIFFFVFNGVVSGFLYQWLKFDVFNHEIGSGVIPGPWIVLPFLSIAVLFGSLVVAALLQLIIHVSKKVNKLSFVDILLMTFLCLSMLLHVLYFFLVVVDPTEYV